MEVVSIKYETQDSVETIVGYVSIEHVMNEDVIFGVQFPGMIEEGTLKPILPSDHGDSAESFIMLLNKSKVELVLPTNKKSKETYTTLIKDVYGDVVEEFLEELIDEDDE